MKKGVSKYPELTGLSGRTYSHAYDAMKTRNFQALHLTSRGTVRRRSLPSDYHDLRGLPRKVYNRIRARRWRARAHPNRIELAWRAFRAEMGEIIVPDVGTKSMTRWT